MIYARLIGIDNYAFGAGLHGCKTDVANMAAFLGGHNVRVLNPSLQDSSAYREAIVETLQGDVDRLGDGDELIVHFSGHGATVDVGGGNAEAVVCPYDFREGVRTTGIGAADVDALVANMLPTARMTIFADCCFSGGLQPDYVATLRRTISGAMQLVGSWLRISPRRVRVRSFARSPVFTVTAAQLPLAATGTKGNVVVLAANRGKSGEYDFGQGYEGVFTHFLLQHLSDAGTAEPASSTCDAVNNLTLDFAQQAELHGRSASYGDPLIQAANAPPPPAAAPSTALT